MLWAVCGKGYEDITIRRKNVASRTQVSSDLIHVLTPQELKRLDSGENITIEENIYYNNDGKTELRKVHIVISLHSNYEKTEITLIVAMRNPLIMIKYKESSA